jgi:Fic family protein
MHDADDEREIDVTLLARVCGEYIEMPGLQLTLAQASRLWNVELATSARLLDRLVATSFLRRTGNHYVRVDSGRLCA